MSGAGEAASSQFPERRRLTSRLSFSVLLAGRVRVPPQSFCLLFFFFLYKFFQPRLFIRALYTVELPSSSVYAFMRNHEYAGISRVRNTIRSE